VTTGAKPTSRQLEGLAKVWAEHGQIKPLAQRKPCPFCGSTKIADRPGVGLMCRTCLAAGPAARGYDWNSRA
jgi:hypothetical protein